MNAGTAIGIKQGKLSVAEESRLSVIVLTLTVLATICAMPVFNWLRIVNTETLYPALKAKADAIVKLGTEYSLLNNLSFVQYSGLGSLGMYAFILAVLLVAALVLFAIYLVRLARGRTPMQRLSASRMAVTVNAFWLAVSLGTIGYQLFAANALGGSYIALSPLAYVTAAASLGGLVAAILQRREYRAVCNETGFLSELKKNWLLFLMLIPTFTYFLINAYLPMVGIYFSFTSFNFRDGLFASPFSGMKNFEFLFRSELQVLVRNTVLYNVVFIALGNILQIFFAILVSQMLSKWYKKATQTLIFMPYFVSFVILKVLVFNLFEYDRGLINNTLTSMGMAKLDFYNSPSYWPWLITLFYIWKNLGYGMVIYLATITGIDQELYEAADIDGANVLQKIRFITLPLLNPTFIILLLYAIGSIMKGQFELFYQLVGTNGVLYGVTDIIDTYVYRISTTQPLNIGIGTAAGLFQSVFGFVLVMLTNVLVKRKHPEYALF